VNSSTTTGVAAADRICLAPPGAVTANRIGSTHHARRIVVF
jgi:hypothetical protein